MAFDGGFLHKVIEELNSATDCHIDKIYQPSKEELVFLLRKKGFVKRLLITIKNGSARIHFTENKYENPPVAPNFCMLLRKYLSSAKLLNISQPDFERIAELNFSATNELGDLVNLKLICELIGNQGNVILLNSENRIIDALRHSDVETAKRLILPGALYEYPTRQEKSNPLTQDTNFICETCLSSDKEINKSLLGLMDGFSPLVCREIEYQYQKQLQSSNDKKVALKTAVKSVVSALEGKAVPTIVFTLEKSPLEFSYIPIMQYGEEYTTESFESFSKLLDVFFTARDTNARISSAAHDIIKLLSNLTSRTERKLALRLHELKKCEGRDTLRIYGELIKANLHQIPNGSNCAVVANYYDPEMKEIKIPLNPALSPAKNAEKYFKDYKKTYTAEQTLSALTEQDKEELKYFESVKESISRCTTLSDLAEIRQELAEGGYIKQIKTQKKNKTPVSTFKEYVSDEGYKILVGKNNTQNDYITTRLATKGDMWFHVKNIAGSHVVVFCSGNELTEDTIIFAATLAASNSKAADSSQVPVDYTPIKFVKKPSGAKPGMVIYTTNKTVFVTPKKEEEL